MVTLTDSSPCLRSSMTQPAMSTKEAESAVALSQFTWSHGTQTFLNIFSFARTMARKRIELVISSTLSGSPTSS